MTPNVAIHCAYTSLRPTSDLRPNPLNPNQHSAHQLALLAKIIQEQGWRNPITVSKRSGLVVRGHGRLEAAILLGCEVVPIDEQEYASEAAELADLLADNRLSELADLDPDGLKTLLTKIGETDPTFDRELAGYGEDEIAKLFEVEPAVEEELTIPDMELQAFEHHDYLMFVFDDQRDFMRALQIAAIGKVNFSISRSSARVGLGRVVPGRRFIELVAPRLPASTAPELPPEPDGAAAAQPRAKATTQSPRARA
jgi:hypothetical protein